MSCRRLLKESLVLKLLHLLADVVLDHRLLLPLSLELLLSLLVGGEGRGQLGLSVVLLELCVQLGERLV